jgi:hypothetical protein
MATQPVQKECYCQRCLMSLLPAYWCGLYLHCLKLGHCPCILALFWKGNLCLLIFPQNTFCVMCIVTLRHVEQLEVVKERLNANSHVPCRSHAIPLPCHAAESLDCVFPIAITQWGHVWFARAMPRPCRSESDFSRSWHSAAWAWRGMCALASAIQRRQVGDLLTFGFFRLPRGVPRRLLSEAYQSVKLLD